MSDRVSSRLSSAITSPDTFFDSKAAAEEVLNNCASNGEGKHISDLRIFMEILPHEGRQNLYDDVVNCKDQLQKLRDNIVSSLIAPMKARGETPSITPSPRPEAHDDLSRVASEIQPSRRSAQLKNDCLERDGWKCVVTGAYDAVAESMVDTSDARVPSDESECAHIIPFAFANFSDTEVGEHAAIWDSLYRYFPEVEKKLQPHTINDHRNAMTLQHGIHRHFGKFHLSLEETNEPNVYFVKAYDELPGLPRRDLPKDGKVTIVNHQEKFALPDPTLLGVHAAIARFLHMSGMGEHIDRIMRDRENIRCLAPDGSTNIGELLAF